MLAGAAIEVPVIAVTVWLLSLFGVGDPDAGFMKIMRLTAAFVGIAALFTAGGIGRVAAYGYVQGGRPRAVFVAARAHAVASAGLVLIAAIPHGLPPRFDVAWIALPAAGLLAGILCGSIIGFICGSVTPLGFSEVWSLAQRPGDALRNLLDPRDLVKLGSVLRTRTSTLFEGIFEPAPPAPPASPPSKPTEAPPAEPTEPSKPA
ncbi:MAG TPA: hypothetical protein VIU61_00580 [Kofleriaceae bacterium]